MELIMSHKQLASLQLHAVEFVFLAALAFLPFFIAQKVVGVAILSVGAMFAIYYMLKRLLTQKIEITGQAVLITWCDTGFGNALAQRLDGMGFLVLAGCLLENSDGARRLKGSNSGRLHVFELDVTSDESVDSCLVRVNELAKESGLWALVNNAGINSAADFEFCTMDMFRRVMEVNLYGSIRMTKTFLPLIRRAKGRVLNVSDAKGQLSMPSNSACGITKYGLEALSDVLRLEMHQFGVQVIVIEPGNFGGATGMLSKFSLARMGDDYDEMWEKANDDIKHTYGKSYLEAQYNDLVQSASSSCTTMVPVIDAMEDAICNAKPSVRYLVNGSNQWLDYNNVLINLKPFLPTRWMDSLLTPRQPRAAQPVR